jgi:polyisoprenoid-binding protein YceI
MYFNARRILPALFAFTCLTAAPAHAEIEKYLFDKPHTQILFFVQHMGFAKSSGEFLDYSGEILWDKAEPEKSSVTVTIPLKSLDMGDTVWNEHTLTKLFEAEKYPDMTFRSTKIEKTGDKTANITGDLTLHGVTKPVVLTATLAGEGKHPMKSVNAAGFAATTNIKRSEFGMNEGIPMVGDDVEIRIEVEAYQEDKTAEGNQNK